jgi:hypothetical protein
VHQGSYGKLAQVRDAKLTGTKKCDQAHDLIDFVKESDVPVFNSAEYSYFKASLALPPAFDTLHSAARSAAHEGEKVEFALQAGHCDAEASLKLTNQKTGFSLKAGAESHSPHHAGAESHSPHHAPKFFPGINVSATHHEGTSIDQKFSAIYIKDVPSSLFSSTHSAARSAAHEGAESHSPHHATEKGLLVTPPPALELLLCVEAFYASHSAANTVRQSRTATPRVPKGHVELISHNAPRVPVKLTETIRCKHCKSLHEDVGEYFGQNYHKKHLCGQCGREIFGKPNIGNPLVALSNQLEQSTIQAEKTLRLDTSRDKFMLWPTVPALVYKSTRHSAAQSAAHEGEKVEFALQTGAESTPRVPSGHVELLCGQAAQHSPHRGTVQCARTQLQGVHVKVFDSEEKCISDDIYKCVWIDGEDVDRGTALRKSLKLFQGRFNRTAL